MDKDLVARLEAAVERLEALLVTGSRALPAGHTADEPAVARLDALLVTESRALPAGHTADEPAAVDPAIAAFDELLDNYLGRLSAAADKIRGPVQDVTKILAEAFAVLKELLIKAKQCQKPDLAGLQEFLKPLNEVILRANALAERGRRSEFFNHLKAAADSLKALGWVKDCGTRMPISHVEESWEKAGYYNNKILMEYRTKHPNHIQWAKALKELYVPGLRDYVKSFFPLGIVWGSAGVAVVSAPGSGSSVAMDPPVLAPAAAAVSVAAPPLPPPPSHLPPWIQNRLHAAEKDPSVPAVASSRPRSFLRYPPLQMKLRSESISSEEALRLGLVGSLFPESIVWGSAGAAVVSAPSGSSAAKDPPAVAFPSPPPPPPPPPPRMKKRMPADFRVISSTESLTSATKNGAHSISSSFRREGPPRLELQRGRKWAVENQIGKSDLVIDDCDSEQTVYIYGCMDSVLQIKGKVNNIIVEKCIKTGVVFIDVVAACEIVNCTGVEVHCQHSAPTISVDNTSGCQLYLSKDSLVASITTAQSSEIIVLVPAAGTDNDWVEHALPKQSVHTFKNGKLTTSPISHSGG